MVEIKNSYEVYKDSGVEWLGQIPEHWEIRRLATIGRFSSSGIDKLSNKNEADVKIINYTDVYRNTRLILDSKIDYMVVTTPKSNRLKNLVNKGDLIFLPSSETLEDLGLCALVDEQLENVAFSYHVLRFEFQVDVDHNFKKYLTNNSKILNQFSRKGTGSIRKTLNRNDFRDSLVLLPPHQEQTVIATFLDDKTAKIDQAIAIKEKQIALLKERKQIIIQEAITKGLDKNVKLKDSGVEWIGEIPEHWGVIKSQWLFTERKERARPYDIQLTSSQKFGVIPQAEFMQIEGRKVTQVVFNNEIQKHVEVGDFMISMRSFQGGLEYSNYQGCISSAYVSLIPSGEVHHEFYKYLFKSQRYIEALQSTSNLVRDGQALRYFNFKQVPLLKIPIFEQKEIGKFIETQSAKIEIAVSIKEQEIEKLKEYKVSLIDAVVTGKVRVC